MTLLDLKIVPDASPNADGEWIRAEVPHLVDPYDFAPRPGYHVVKHQRPKSNRDGGSMHATGYQPPGS